MKTKFAVITALLSSLMLMNCSDDIESKSIKPQLNDIELIPSTCNAGDSVVVKLSFAKEGKYFYFYNQELTLSDSILVYRQQDGSHTSKLPEIKFAAPEKAGKYTVKFNSKISYTSGTSLFDVLEPVEATLTVTK